MNIFLIIICFIKKMSVDKKIGSWGHEPIEGVDKKLGTRAKGYELNAINKKSCPIKTAFLNI